MNRSLARRLRQGDATGIAIRGAALLTEHDRARLLQPVQAAFAHLRQGVGTWDDWVQLASMVNIALAIERQGVVRGLAEHLHSAELTLQTIHRRAEEDQGSRYPYALHLGEIEALHTAVDLHAFQLAQLCHSEYRRAYQYVVAEVTSTGGQAVAAKPMQPQQQGALAL